MKKLLPLLLLSVSLSGYMQDKRAVFSPKMFDRLSQAGSPGQFDGWYFQAGKYISLGLSLGFDIVVKGQVEGIGLNSADGQGAFTIILPTEI